MLCPIAIGLAGCATESATTAERFCAEPEIVRIDRVTIPTNNVTAREFAFDLDGNHTPDNAIGMVAGVVHDQITGLDLSAALSERLANDLEWSIAIASCGDGSVDVSLAPPNVADGTVHMTGVDESGRVVAGGEDGVLPMSAMFDPDGAYGRPGWVRARIAHVEVVSLVDATWEGRIAMAFTHRDVVDAITQPMAEYLTRHGLLLQYFDTSPVDGTITVTELQNSNLVHALLSPDIEHDDLRLLSLGIGFSASAR